ncbi:hypothetical protein DSO57_1004742 [Entomophthora muscae]|uniref:Uncharacterized protein n=1 Tax=Entomophthora muscae TaxID=34485 RepID=A0ACC2TJ49_9FUNG|nr:hypothetical protein DSO57_1004742 [Entomophthora muscae]
MIKTPACPQTIQHDTTPTHTKAGELTIRKPRTRSVNFNLAKNQIRILPSMKAIKSTIKQREQCNCHDHSNFSILSLSSLPHSVLPDTSCTPKSPALKHPAVCA